MALDFVAQVKSRGTKVEVKIIFSEERSDFFETL